MRWLLDEMLPSRAAQELRHRGHDAVSVREVGLVGQPDDEVFSSYAVAEGRCLVTEDFADYVALLEQRLGRDEPSTPVVFVRKPSLRRGGALPAHLASILDNWATRNPTPYPGPHWPTSSG